MVSHVGRIIGLLLVCHVFCAGGCAVVSRVAESVSTCSEVIARKAEYHAARRQAKLDCKLAKEEACLAQQQAGVATSLETTMAMDINNSLNFEDITVDVDELKRVIARHEAYARAEALRQRRLPQLLREQQEALRQGGANVAPVPMNNGASRDQLSDSGVKPAQFSDPVRPGTEADMVVAVDQFGNPLPVTPVEEIRIAPWEIPFNMRVRLNLGVNNPRVQCTRLRRQCMDGACGPGCGGCASCCDSCDGCDSGCDRCGSSPCGCLGQATAAAPAAMVAATKQTAPAEDLADAPPQQQTKPTKARTVSQVIDRNVNQAATPQQAPPLVLTSAQVAAPQRLPASTPKSNDGFDNFLQTVDGLGN